MTIIDINPHLKTETIYIFLIRTDSFFSRIIAAFTGRKYTHASIGFDSDCTSLYSFARIKTERPIPAGFVKESRDTGLLKLSPNAPCAVFKLKITEQSYLDIRRDLEQMYLNKSKFRYNYAGPFLCFFGIPLHINNSYFCSQFVAELLSKHHAVTLTKPSTLYHPSDLARLPGLTLVFQGKLSEVGAAAPYPFRITADTF